MPERRCILQLCLVAWQPARGLNTWVQTHREPWLVTAVSHFVTDWQSRELPLKEVPLKFECKFALRYVHAWSYFFWLSATLWPFDEISEDRRTHTLTLEHPVPKSLSNMALLKYYGCLLFFKCSQMYPTKDLFQVLKQSQKSLFIFTVMHRQKNIAVVNLVSTSCVRSERCPSACDVCVRGGLTSLPVYSNMFWREEEANVLPPPLLLETNILPLRQHQVQSPPVHAPTPQRAKTLTRVRLCGPCSCEPGRLQSGEEIKSTDSLLWCLPIQAALQSNLTPGGRLWEPVWTRERDQPIIFCFWVVIIWQFAPFVTQSILQFLKAESSRWRDWQTQSQMLVNITRDDLDHVLPYNTCDREKEEQDMSSRSEHKNRSSPTRETTRKFKRGGPVINNNFIRPKLL